MTDIESYLEMALWRIKDMLKGDDGQAWKEAEKFLPRAEKVLADYREKPNELIAALRIIDDLHDLGDAIYEVRSRATEDDEDYDGNTWEHPDVVAYGNAVAVVKDAIGREV